MSTRRSELKQRSRWIETLENMILLSAGVTDIEAFHQDGQTFLTWQEDTTIDGESYHVYRHDEAITAQNIGDAELLTAHWGPLDDDTSVHQLAGTGAPQNFVIKDLGQALSNDTGLFVYTTQEGEEGNAFYAVTLVVGGVEQALDASNASLAQGVQETVQETAPVLVNSVNGGKGLIFTQFMDYKAWNPTFQGYAYNYAVALPDNYDPSQAYPLKVELHAYTEGHKFVPSSEFGWPTIELFLDDPGVDRGTIHTWWYGFAADHNYNTDGPIPTSGTIENFTEQRVLKAIDEVIANASFNVDTAKIHAYGHSMGGSGALSLGIRYGDVFAGIYSSEGMTDYAASPLFQGEFVRLWGSQSSNLQIVNNGIHAPEIAKYGAGQSDATGVWDWMDHGEQLLRRRGESISFLMFGHGKDDAIIEWASQGQPFIADVEAANIAFTAEQRDSFDHSWMGFGFAPHTLFSGGYGDLGTWLFENTTSFLGISHASDSGPAVPGSSGTDQYNLSIDWSTAWNNFHQDIVDTNSVYEVSVRSLTSTQTADITPRNLQNFSYNVGDTIEWKNVSNSSGQILQQGVAVVDADGLLTIPDFVINTGIGSRLILSADPGAALLPQLVILDSSVVEGNSGQKTVQVEARLNQVSDTAVTAQFATQNGTATAGADYVAVSGEITIPAGSLNAVIDIDIPGDDLLEANETFSVSLSGAQNAIIADAQATVTILNDDAGAPPIDPPVDPPSTGDATRLVAIADTVLTNTELRNANLGGSESLSLYSTPDGGDHSSLLKFDVSSLNPASLEDATLQLRQLNGSLDNGPIQVTVFAVSSNWAEGTGSDPWSAATSGATYNSTGSGSAWTTAGGDLNTSFNFGNGANGVVKSITLDGFNSADDVIDINVTALVRAWLNGDLQNNGLALKITQGDWNEYLFASTESQDTGSRPALVINSGLVPG